MIMLSRFLCVVVCVFVCASYSCALYSNSWAVEVIGGDAVADALAKKHGVINLGKVGALEGVYHFSSPNGDMDDSATGDFRRTRRNLHSNLMAEEQVSFVEQQVILRRVKKDYSPPSDSKWSQQWYLHRSSGHDMNVQLAWEQNITGRGSVVTILDDGLEHTHPDLHRNYDQEASYDFNSHDKDPFPRYDPTNENKHGTRCAGEVAANRNGKCGVGAAYDAKIGGVRMLDGDVTDVVEASSLSLNPQHIDIYSSSWGPTDDGRTVDGPGRLAKQAFVHGVTKGRGGLGSIFVWAAGNGGRYGDSCNCDGYAVSPYTISVGSASERDNMPWYAESCSSTLTSTYSSGSASERQIVTTDIHGVCTSRHTGTSASAPLAAGIMALALEANRNLTWRDMQYLLVYSSNPAYPHDPSWETNGAGLKVSHEYGFGVLSSATIVNRARNWITVPPQHNCTIDVKLHQKSASDGHPLKVTIPTSNCHLAYLEHAQAITTISLVAGQRSGISIKLTSAMDTTSVLLAHRRMDAHFDGFHQWPFMTVHSWGEDPKGSWTFTIETKSGARVSLDALQLVLYGTLEVPVAVQNIPSECHAQCNGGCAKAGARYCDTCRNVRVASTLECVDSCPEETYTNYHMCRDCPVLCAECQNGRSCMKCKPGAVTLDNGLCAAACPKLTYLAPNGSCQPCHHSCLSCSGPDGQRCTECPGQYALQDGACVQRSSCPDGQFFNHRTLECRFCDKSCAQCSGKGEDQCTSCFVGYALTQSGGGKCVQDQRNPRCVAGKYYNDGNSTCLSCPEGCSECSDELTCTECEDGHFFENRRVGESSEERKVCVSGCSRGFYGDVPSQSCQPCPPYCSTCTSLDVCTSCTFNSTQPVKGQCPHPCHDGQYYDFGSQQCLACAVNCQQCVNGEQCTQCSPELYRTWDGACVEACPAHMITNEQSRMCENKDCHRTCLTCFGTEPDECMSCPQDTILHENACIQDCPTHTFFNGSGCQHCHASCASCAGPAEDNCDSCPPGNVLDHFHCIRSCPPGSFLSSRDCIACPLNCKNCSDPMICDICNNGYLMLPTNHSCVEHCPKGYLETPTVCRPCLSHCEVCSSVESCVKCSSGYVYYDPDKSCLEQCPDGYYSDGSSCSECKFPCSSCTSSPSHCTVCGRGHVMDSDTHTCKPCCNADTNVHPCCDCDSDANECLWTDSFRPPSPASTTDAPRTSLPYIIIVIVVLVLAAVAALAILIGLKRYRSRSVSKYDMLPTGPKDGLEIMDESGSEAEIYAAHT